MAKRIVIGGCVKIPDGRIARVRKKSGNEYVVRVRRKTSKTHQFLKFPSSKLKSVPCPKGWMSVQGYNRYLKITLSKMKKRKR
jgi:hypothetical protein